MRSGPRVLSPRGVIPAPTTPLLGRGVEFAQITDLLWNPDVRLVSLLGPGGIGKTRLAVEVAWELYDGTGFTDGVWFVDLASVNDPELAPATVARAIGIVDMGMDTTSRQCGRSGRDMCSCSTLRHVAPHSVFVAERLAARPAGDPGHQPPALHLHGETRRRSPLGSDAAVARSRQGAGRESGVRNSGEDNVDVESFASSRSGALAIEWRRPAGR